MKPGTASATVATRILGNDPGLRKTGFGQRLLKPATPLRDAKTALQEWAQGRGMALPAYKVVGREGPDHAPSFTVSVTVGDYEPELAQGPSRQEAEKAAALIMLLKREGPL